MNRRGRIDARPPGPLARGGTSVPVPASRACRTAAPSRRRRFACPGLLRALVLWTVLAGGVAAQTVTLEVRTESLPVVGEQGRPVTVAVAVRNDGGAPVALFDRVTPPAGWSVVGDERPYTVPAGGRSVRLITVVVPRTATVDTYPVLVRTMAASADAAAEVSRGEVSFSVTVRPVYGVAVRSLLGPRYAVAGLPYESSFEVENTGNVAARVALTGVSNGGYRVRLEADTLQLAPAERRRVAAVTTAPESMPRAENASLRFRADLVGGDASALPSRTRTARTTTSTLVLPELAGGGVAYHRYPAVFGVSAGAISGAPGGDLTPTMRLYGQGRGSLRQGSAAVLAFEITPPYLGQADGMSGRYDNYQASLEHPNYLVTLGDGPYRLSTLSSHFGFGGSGYARPGRVGVGAFYLVDRFGRTDEVDAGAQADVYVAGGRARLGLNVLRSEGGIDPDATYTGVEGSYAPRPGTLAEAEVGLSRQAEGATGLNAAATARAQVGATNLTGFVRARDQSFPGVRGDQRTGGGSASTALGRRWRLSLGGSLAEQSFALADGRTSAFETRTLRGGVSYAQSVALEGRVLDRTTQFASLEQRRTETFAQLTLRTRARRARLALRGTAGTAAARVDADTRHDVILGAGGDASYGLSSALDLSATADVVQGRGAAGLGDAPRTYAAAASVSFRPSSQITLLSSASATHITGAFASSFQSYRAQATANLPWRHQLGAAAEYARFSFGAGPGATGAFSALLTYTVPVGVRLHRDRATGVVGGRLTNQVTGRGMGGVPVMLGRGRDLYGGGITDGDGAFALTGVSPGAYTLHADPGATEPGLILDGEGALTVDVVGGERTDVALRAVRAGELRVRLELVPPGDGPGPRTDARPGPIPGFVVHVAGADSLNGFTDGRGTATFGQLRPGRYAASVGDRHRADYELASADTSGVIVGPGESAEVVLQIRPRRRSVWMARTGAVALSTSTARSRVDPDRTALAAGPMPRTPAPRQARQPGTVGDDGTYTVGTDDTLIGIARRMYGDGTLWPVLWEANRSVLSNPDVIQPGRRLVVPAAPAAPQGAGQPYTIGPNDTLISIARRVYGDGALWPVLWEANRSVVPDPNTIQPGRRLVVPSPPAAPNGAEQPYTINANDTLIGIARRIYGDGALWPVLWEANRSALANPDVIQPGRQLVVPPSHAARQGVGQPYTIGTNDTLIGIARRVYGDGALWPTLWQANLRSIPNPNLILVGRQILLPRVDEPGS